MRYPTPGPTGGAPWRVKIRVVHDGDTCSEVDVDRGDDDRSVWSVRLKDVFAPELSQVGGPECRAHAQEWVAAHGDGSDWPFLLETFRTPKSDVDVKTLSRQVGRITAADGSCLNDEMTTFVAANGYGHGIGG